MDALILIIHKKINLNKIFLQNVGNYKVNFQILLINLKLIHLVLLFANYEFKRENILGNKIFYQ